MRGMKSWFTKETLGLHELKESNFWRAVFGEFISTILYSHIICSAGLSLGVGEPTSRLHAAFTSGLTVAILASAFWEISGGHFNPAVSVLLLFRGAVSITRCLLYVVAQCAGSVCGCALLYLCTPSSLRASLGSLFLHPELPPIVAFVFEMVISFPLLLTVITSTAPERGFKGFQAPFAIGISVTIGLLSGIPYTGGCMNPIRALGPAVVMQTLDGDQWVYWAGPILSGILASLSYDYMFYLRPTAKCLSKQTSTDTQTIEVMDDMEGRIEGKNGEENMLLPIVDKAA